MHRRTNPKKMRRRLRAGECNLSDVGLENLSNRQVRKMAQLAKSIVDETEAHYQERKKKNAASRKKD